MKHLKSNKAINIGKYLCLLSLVLALLIGFSFPVAAGEIQNSSQELVILYTNDTHSNLFPFGPKDQHGGIARMSTMIKEVRSENENVLALHAGDVFVGTFAFNRYLGYPELKIMENLYDAMALGNHEFDLGPEVLGYILSGFNPVTAQSLGDPITLPILSANVDLSAYSMLNSFVDPWIIKEVGGIKVGLLGVVTNNPLYYSPSIVGIFSDPFISAAIAAAQLQIAGCDLVIAISHLGKDFDVLGLSEVPGIDVIVGGHSHDVLDEPIIINGKIIVQAGEFGKNLGELRVSVDTNSHSVNYVDNILHPINSEIQKDPALQGYLNELRDGIYNDPRFGPIYSQHIAKAMWDHEEKWLSSDPYREPSHKDTPLGNLIADAFRSGVENAGYPVNIALQTNGYIGHKIYETKVTANDIIRALPYGYDPATGLGFKIKLINLFGIEIHWALEYTVQMAELTDELSIQVSGLTFEYDSSNPPFARVDFTSIRINNVPIYPYPYPYGMYTIAVNEALVAFLEGLGFDLTGRIIDPSPDLFEFNLVKDYMLQLNHLTYTSEGRIIDNAELP